MPIYHFFCYLFKSASLRSDLRATVNSVLRPWVRIRVKIGRVQVLYKVNLCGVSSDQYNYIRGAKFCEFIELGKYSLPNGESRIKEVFQKEMAFDLALEKWDGGS